MKIAHTIHNKTLLLTLAVFALCLTVRIYWISQKNGLYGDEQTSLSLAYNVEGWGSKSYEEGRVYSAVELRRILYVDDEGGWNGYVNDIRALWTDNRDKSHASLYYMALRTALIGQNKMEAGPIVWRGCGLNLLFFVISFFCLSALSRNLFPDKPWIGMIVLLFAFCNPLSVSNTLLLREYSLAECLISAFSLMSVILSVRIKNKTNLLTPFFIVGVALLTAAVLSTGYFNSLFVVLSCLCLLGISYNESASVRKNMIYFVVVAALSLVFCLLMYRGFFNFLEDDRTAEVMDKIEGGGFFNNIYVSIKSGLGMLVRNMVGLPFCLWSLLIIAVAIIKKKRIDRIGHQWIFVISAIWITVVLVLSTWKMTRYIASCVPLLMIAVSYYVMEFTVIWNKKLLWIPVALFLAYSFSGKGIEYLMKGDEIFSEFPKAKRLLLYATYDGDRNTLPLLTPYLTNEQECLIISNPKDVFTQSLPTDSVVYVFADKNMDALRRAEGFRSEYPFNGWQNIYLFERK